MENYLPTATILANILDNQFKVFGIRMGFGTVLDLIPEVGDVVATMLSLYIVWIAIKAKVPPSKLSKMVFNVSINFIFGTIPFLGSIAYIVNRANLKNLEILKNHLETNPKSAYSTLAI